MDARSIGLICGIVVGLLFAALILKFVNRNGKMKVEYDELQTINRNKAYKVGFSATMIYSGLLCTLSLIDIEIPMEVPVIFFSIIFVGVLAVASTSLWNNSYWGLSTNATRFWIIIMIAAAINFIVPIKQMMDGELIVNGKLSTPAVNLLCGMMILIIAVEAIVKQFVDKKAGGDDEES